MPSVYKPKITATKLGANRNCVSVTTGRDFLYGVKPKDPWGYFGGRKITFKVCAVANGIQISRGGRSGGGRAYPSRSPGGMTVCTAAGAGSKCLRARDFIAFPGGAGAFKRRGQSHMVLNGFGGLRRRKSRKSRR